MFDDTGAGAVYDLTGDLPEEGGRLGVADDGNDLVVLQEEGAGEFKADATGGAED